MLTIATRRAAACFSFKFQAARGIHLSSPFLSSKPAPKVLPQKYLKFMTFIHYYNQHLVDNNISTRKELDNLSKLWSSTEEQISFVDSFLDSDRLKEFKKVTSNKKAEKLKKQRDEEKKKNKEDLKKENRKNAHLSDLRDELKDQKDEGLMAYVKENVPIDITALETQQEKKKVSTGSRKLDAVMAHYRY